MCFQMLTWLGLWMLAEYENDTRSPVVCYGARCCAVVMATFQRHSTATTACAPCCTVFLQGQRGTAHSMWPYGSQTRVWLPSMLMITCLSGVFVTLTML